MKNLLKKAHKSGKVPHIALLEYLNTPLEGMDGYSPAQLLHNRILKSKLPTVQILLKPKITPQMTKQLIARQEKQKFYHNKVVKSLPELKENQTVRFKGLDGEWLCGKIIGKHTMPRSYMLEKHNSKVFRRNRRDLFPIPEQSAPVNVPEVPVHTPASQQTDSQSEAPGHRPQPEPDHDKPEQSTPSRFRTEPDAPDRFITSRYGRVIKHVKKLNLWLFTCWYQSF